MRNIKNADDEKYFKELQNVKLTFLKLQNELFKYDKNKRKKRKFQNIEYIVEHYNKEPISDIAKETGYTICSIRNLAREYYLTNLYLKENEITLCTLYRALTGEFTSSYNLELLNKYGLPFFKRSGVKIINIYDFYDWYKKHIKLIQIHKYKKGSLPYEPKWFLEKARADKRAREYTYKRKWTDKEDMALKSLVMNKKTYFEISKELKRTGQSIKRRCLDLNISKPKRTAPKPWTKEQIKNSKNLWLKGYEPCIIAEEIGRSDREIISYLERFKYFDMPPQKFNTNCFLT